MLHSALRELKCEAYGVHEFYKGAHHSESYSMHLQG